MIAAPVTTTRGRAPSASGAARPNPLAPPLEASTSRPRGHGDDPTRPHRPASRRPAERQRRRVRHHLVRHGGHPNNRRRVGCSARQPAPGRRQLRDLDRRRLLDGIAQEVAVVFTLEESAGTRDQAAEAAEGKGCVVGLRRGDLLDERDRLLDQLLAASRCCSGTAARRAANDPPSVGRGRLTTGSGSGWGRAPGRRGLRLGSEGLRLHRRLLATFISCSLAAAAFTWPPPPASSADHEGASRPGRSVETDGALLDSGDKLGSPILQDVGRLLGASTDTSSRAAACRPTDLGSDGLESNPSVDPLFCRRFALRLSRASAAKRFLRLARDHGTLLIGEVSPMEVQGEHELDERTLAVPRPEARDRPQRSARGVPVPAVDDLALVEPDGLAQVVLLNVVGEVLEVGLGHHRGRCLRRGES